MTDPQWTDDDLVRLDELIEETDERIAKLTKWERQPAPLRALLFWRRP